MTIPEIGDEVLVSFMHGDINHAVVVGSLYNGVDLPPYANEDGENNLRVFPSRVARVPFDDTDEAGVEVVTHNQEIRIIWDAVGKVFSVYSGGDINIEAKGINVRTETFSLSASEQVNIEGQGPRDAGGQGGRSAGRLPGADSSTRRLHQLTGTMALQAQEGEHDQRQRGWRGDRQQGSRPHASHQGAVSGG